MIDTHKCAERRSHRHFAKKYFVEQVIQSEFVDTQFSNTVHVCWKGSPPPSPAAHPELCSVPRGASRAAQVDCLVGT